jgi:hypothetical protein
MPRPVPIGPWRRLRVRAAAIGDQDKLRQCIRATGDYKDGYRRRGEALQVIGRVKRKPDFALRPGYGLGAYRCEVCNLWHIGARPRTEGQQPE